MNVHFILSHLYEGHIYHAYLNSLSVSKGQNDAIITHEGYIERKLDYDELYFKVFEMEKISEDEKTNILQYGIPDDFYTSLFQKYGSKTKAYSHLFNERDLALENYLYEAIDKLGSKNIEKFYVFGETCESVRYVAQQLNIQIVNYEFSTVRRVSGYSCDLMHAYTQGYLYGHNQLLNRYKKFCDEIDTQKLLSREELIALFVPRRQLIFLPLINSKPKYEIGILSTGSRVVLPFSGRYNTTDDDVYAKCREYYEKEEIIIRNHPGFFQENELVRDTAERDTLPFILSCKRIASVSSNGLFEAMLWNRTACILSDAMSFYFQCAHDFSSLDTAPIEFLNFYLIAALVPSQKLLFDSSYWKMIEELSEAELFEQNLFYILDNLGIDKNILAYPKKERLQEILAVRGMDYSLIEKAYDVTEIGNIEYKYIQSELVVVNSQNQKKKYDCINYRKSDDIISNYEVNENIQHIEFNPIKGKIGLYRIKSILFDEVCVWSGEGEIYFAEKDKYLVIESKSSKQVTNVKVIWEVKEFSATSIKEIIAQNKESKKIIESIYSSYSWKLSKPVRVLGSIMNLLKSRNLGK